VTAGLPAASTASLQLVSQTTHSAKSTIRLQYFVLF